VHLHPQHAVALAGLAAPALDIEAEAARVIAAGARLGHCGEQLADDREQPGVGRRVRARRAADRILVDLDHPLEALEAIDFIARPGAIRTGIIQLRGGVAKQGVIHQG